MAQANIRITGSGPTDKDHRIYLDGVDISHYVRGFRITSRIGFPDTVELELIGNVELPDDFQAKVLVLDTTAIGDEYKHFSPVKVGD